MKNKKQNIVQQHDCSYYSEYKPFSNTSYKMNKCCTKCKKIIEENIFPAKTVEGFIRRWVHGKLTDYRIINGKKVKYTQEKLGKYHSKDNKLFYIGCGRYLTEELPENLALILPDGRKIANASKLKRCGSYTRGIEAPAQQVMQKLKIPMIPFNIFEESKLDITKAEVIEQGKAENILAPKLCWGYYEKAFVPMKLWPRKYSAKKRPSEKSKTRNLSVNKERIWKNGKFTGKTKKTYSYEYFEKKNLEKRHFVGSMLLKVNDEKGKGRYFLFDCDRNELKFYNFNPFLTELPKKAKNIKQAYELLKPIEVKKAEKKGLKILRQGEWFFIPKKIPKEKKLPKDFQTKEVPDTSIFDLNIYSRWGEPSKITAEETKQIIKRKKILKKYHKNHKARIRDYNKEIDIYLENQKTLRESDHNKYCIEGTLQAGQNRPNEVQKYIELKSGIYVKGKVTHSGREHEPIILKDWCKPVPNTAIKSFTITGAID